MKRADADARRTILLEHIAERRFLQREQQRIAHRIDELTRIIGDRA